MNETVAATPPAENPPMEVSPQVESSASAAPQPEASEAPKKVDPSALAAIIAEIEARQKEAKPTPVAAPKRAGKARARSEEDAPELSKPVAAPEPRLTPALHGQSLRNSLNAEIEAELAAAMADLDPTSLMQAKPEMKPAAGQAPPDSGRKKGVVISIHKDDVFVDIGGRTQGVLSLDQFVDGPPNIGDPVECTIQGFDAANGCLLLSKGGAVAQAVDWSTVAEGMVVEAKVTGDNKGGLSVEVNGIRGFLPISQLELFRVEDLKPYLNQKLVCLVTEANASEKNLVVSRRALLEREREETKAKLWAELAEGQTRSGVVRNVKEFGAFIDLGGVDGLLPVSEMSWGRVERPEDVVSIGQRLDVVVHRIDHERQKLSLSLKPLLKSPWETSGDQLTIGSTLTGKVTRLAEFGAFVEIAPGLDGLVHISEIATKRINRPEEVLKVGQDVVVQIIKIDDATKRIGLSIKAVQKAAEEAARAESAAQEEAARAKAEAAEDAKPVKPVVRRTDLKGGKGAGGPLFSLPGR